MHYCIVHHISGAARWHNAELVNQNNPFRRSDLFDLSLSSGHYIIRCISEATLKGAPTPVFTFSDEILAKIIFTTLGGFSPRNLPGSQTVEIVKIIWEISHAVSK